MYEGKQIFIHLCRYIQLIYLQLVVIPNGHSFSRDFDMTNFTLFDNGEQVGKTGCSRPLKSSTCATCGFLVYISAVYDVPYGVHFASNMLAPN